MTIPNDYYTMRQMLGRERVATISMIVKYQRNLRRTESSRMVRGARTEVVNTSRSIALKFCASGFGRRVGCDGGVRYRAGVLDACLVLPEAVRVSGQ